MIGGLYNGSQPPPEKLPDRKMQAVLRDQLPGGTLNGEIVFNHTLTPGAAQMAIRSGTEPALEVDPRGEGIVLRAGTHFIRLSPTEGLSSSAPIAVVPAGAVDPVKGGIVPRQ